jgi:hypothetical protein
MTNPWIHRRTQFALEDGGADGSGWAAHEAAGGLVEAEGDRDGDVATTTLIHRICRG